MDPIIMKTDKTPEEFIKTASQIELYFLMMTIGNQRYTISRLWHLGTIEYDQMEKQLKPLYEEQVAISRELARFGVNAVGSDGTPTGDYWKWFYRFDNYVKKLSAADLGLLKIRIESREDTSDIDPKEE